MLNKHPGRLQSVELAIGKAHIFYPVATDAVCTACLMLDINPIDLVRGRGQMAFLQEHYVNDRPYTSNSFLSTAMVKALGSAMNGTSKGKPELADTPIPLTVKVHSLKVDAEKSWLNKLFEPLGYTINYKTLLLDERFPSWGESKTVTEKGGEGMVVKPLDYIAYSKGRSIQPAMKCRGSEYLRIIYGPEYDSPGNLERLKQRNVKVKRELALKEFTLGLESLTRFVKKETLQKVHECVFGVLALESESVDPRL